MTCIHANLAGKNVDGGDIWVSKMRSACAKACIHANLAGKIVDGGDIWVSKMRSVCAKACKD